jgi:hypothetical protein
MFEQTFETLRKATDATLQIQQEAFRKWVNLWPNLPVTQPLWGEQFHKAQKQWTEFVGELVKKQREVFETQFNAGVKGIEEAYKFADTKNPEEMRTLAVELWKKSFESVRQAFEAQVKALQAAVSKWTELVSTGPGA